MARVAGVARSTVSLAVAEVGLAAALDALVDPQTRGDPISPLTKGNSLTMLPPRGPDAFGYGTDDTYYAFGSTLTTGDPTKPKSFSTVSLGSVDEESTNSAV